MKRNVTGGLWMVVFMVFALVAQVFAAELIRERSGTIKITTPSGKVFTIKKKQPLPKIPSGSTIEVLSGTIDIAATKGSLTLKIGGSTAKINAGQRVIATVNAKSGIVDFKHAPGVTIKTGDTTINMKKGQRVKIGLSKISGKVTLKSVKGTITVLVAGVKVIIPKKGIATIGLDAGTVSVKSVSGKIDIVDASGKTTTVTKGQTFDGSKITDGKPVEKKETKKEKKEKKETKEPVAETEEDASGEFEQEPAEPEFPEASPFQP